jgi:hypothetical protein
LLSSTPPTLRPRMAIRNASGVDRKALRQSGGRTTSRYPLPASCRVLTMSSGPYQARKFACIPSQESRRLTRNSHALKDSDVYTGLDFAPPKRFKENGDAMSDAGSIRSYRSNKSGISAISQAALRNGAGRVSRLPGDTVFTQAETSQQLRPSWGMRV